MQRSLPVTLARQAEWPLEETCLVVGEAARPELESSAVLRLINFRQKAKVSGQPSLRCKALQSSDWSRGPQKAEWGLHTPPDEAVLSSSVYQQAIVLFHSTLKKGS